MNSTSSLTGGDGAPPLVEITYHNDASERAFYEPIPNEMLFSPENDS